MGPTGVTEVKLGVNLSTDVHSRHVVGAAIVTHLVTRLSCLQRSRSLRVEERLCLPQHGRPSPHTLAVVAVAVLRCCTASSPADRQMGASRGVLMSSSRPVVSAVVPAAVSGPRRRRVLSASLSTFGLVGQ